MYGIADTTSRILDYRILGNTVRDVLITLAGILIGVMLVRLFQVLIVSRLRKAFAATVTTWYDLLITVLENNVIPALYVLIVWLGLRDLHMKASLQAGIRTLATVAVTLLAIRMAMAVVNHAIHSYWSRHGSERTAARERNLNGIITFVKILVWILGLILLLDNIGIKVSGFVAGLGITGIAVALAAQAILGDLFSYFVIFFDQPFEVGHVIKVDNFTGEVEHIGLKTTRLRSGDGEQIIFSNKNLTDSRVQNFKRMHRRRVVFNLDVDLDTPVETLRTLPALIKAQYAGFADVTFERSHLKQFTESGMRFETSIVVETPDFNRYMDIQHEANLGIRDEFEKAGIRLAVPSRMLRLRKDGEEGFSMELVAATDAQASQGTGTDNPGADGK
ncbi:MAG: mechanosensitive ion channel family protein [Fibrobacterota bacterium]|nr:mechanosensitive ion channel family protein [Fibrobacterota bacterium]